MCKEVDLSNHHQPCSDAPMTLCCAWKHVQMHKWCACTDLCGVHVQISHDTVGCMYRHCGVHVCVFSYMLLPCSYSEDAHSPTVFCNLYDYKDG